MMLRSLRFNRAYGIRLAATCCCALSIGFVSATSLADTRCSAREWEEAKCLTQDKSLEGYDHAQRLCSSPLWLYGRGQALERAGRVDEAYGAYVEATKPFPDNAPDSDEDLRLDCQGTTQGGRYPGGRDSQKAELDSTGAAKAAKRLAELQPRLDVTVLVTGVADSDDAVVEIAVQSDLEPERVYRQTKVALTKPPGSYTVTARVTTEHGTAESARQVELHASEGMSSIVELTLEVEAPAAPMAAPHASESGSWSPPDVGSEDVTPTSSAPSVVPWFHVGFDSMTIHLLDSTRFAVVKNCPDSDECEFARHDSTFGYMGFRVSGGFAVGSHFIGGVFASGLFQLAGHPDSDAQSRGVENGSAGIGYLGGTIGFGLPIVRVSLGAAFGAGDVMEWTDESPELRRPDGSEVMGTLSVLGRHSTQFVLITPCVEGNSPPGGDEGGGFLGGQVCPGVMIDLRGEPVAFAMTIAFGGGSTGEW